MLTIGHNNLNISSLIIWTFKSFELQAIPAKVSWTVLFEPLQADLHLLSVMR